MTLTFITNSLTHHTAPLADALSGWLGTDFHFVETKPLRQERIQLGWQQEPDRPYLLRTYECPETAARCRRLALNSDVVLLGSGSDRWILPRLHQHRLTFRYAERWYKTGMPPARRPGLGCITAGSGHAPLYLLCASAYAAADAALAGCYPGRAYRFGYFPEVKYHNKSALLAQKDPNGRRLLWAGRFLPWKHPLDAIIPSRATPWSGPPCSPHLLGQRAGAPHHGARNAPAASGTANPDFGSSAARRPCGWKWSRPISFSSPQIFRRAGEPC